MASEKRATRKFDTQLMDGTIDAYVTNQTLRGRLNDAQRSELATRRPSTVGANTFRANAYTSGELNDNGHKSMRSTGASSGFGGASLVASMRGASGDAMGGGHYGRDSSRGSPGAVPEGRSQSRHELIMAIGAMERRLKEERAELQSLKGTLGRHIAKQEKLTRPRRVPLNCYHASTGAC